MIILFYLHNNKSSESEPNFSWLISCLLQVILYNNSKAAKCILKVLEISKSFYFRKTFR
jgi:hypothetical protein